MLFMICTFFLVWQKEKIKDIKTKNLDHTSTLINLNLLNFFMWKFVRGKEELGKVLMPMTTFFWYVGGAIICMIGSVPAWVWLAQHVTDDQSTQASTFQFWI